MSNTITDPGPLADVSSLYGPGTLLGWVCTFVSVVINWNFNRDVRDADTLTTDFLAMLAIPIAAAGHVFYLILHYKVTIAQLEPYDPAIDRHVAAVAAPLHTCMGFMAVIHWLEMMAARKRQTKRLVCCLLASLVVTVGQLPAIICRRWPHAHWFSPVMPHFPSLFITFSGVGGIYQALLLVLQWHPAALRYYDVGQLDLVETTAGGEPRPGFACAAHWRREKRCQSCEDCREEAEAVRWARHEVNWPFFTTVAAIWPALFLGVFGIVCSIVGEIFNPVPESPNSILELDQAVALFLGLLTVWRAVWESLRSRQGCTGATDEMKPRVEEAKEILRMYSAKELHTLVHIPLPQSAANRSGWGAWLFSSGPRNIESRDYRIRN